MRKQQYGGKKGGLGWSWRGWATRDSIYGIE
jgi:hypothetical protein